MRTWTPAPLDPDARGDEHVLKLVLESICCGTVSPSALTALWRRHEAKVLKHARGVDRWSWQSGGSWNHGIVALVAWYLYAKAGISARADGPDTPYGILLRYCQRQLQGPPDGHGLGGREMLSRRYLKIVLGALEWAWMRARREEDAELAAAIDRVLEAHALTLALFTVATPFGFVTANPGARSKRGTSHEALSSWVEGHALDKRPWPTSGEGRQWAIGDRLCAASEYWPRVEARGVMRLVADGQEGVGRIVDRLNELGARTVVPVTVYRTEEGIGSWLHANPNGNTAPLLAASCVNGRHYAAHVHPDPEDSRGGRSLGECHGGKGLPGMLIANAVDVIPEYAEPPRGATRLSHGDYYATIPAPIGAVIYEITIDRHGVHLAGSTPSPRPEPRPTPEEPSMTENAIMARILHALSSDQDGNQIPLATFEALLAGGIDDLDVRLLWPPRDLGRYQSFVRRLREMPW